MPRPKVYDDDLRARLLGAAAETIAAGGVEAIALRPLAEREGTSTNAVYTIFGGRDELVAAVVEEAREGFSAAQESVRRSDDALEDLVALGHAYRAWALANPALYEVLMGRLAPADDEHWADDRTVQPLLAGVRRVAEQHALTDGRSAEDVASLLWAGVHGVVSLEIGRWAGRPQAERDRVFDDLLVALGAAWELSPS